MTLSSAPENKALVPAAPLNDIQSFIDRIVDGGDPNIYQELLIFLNLGADTLDEKSDTALLELQQKIYDALNRAEQGGVKSVGQKTVLRALLVTGPELRRCLYVIFEQALRRIFIKGRNFIHNNEDLIYRAAARKIVEILEVGGNTDKIRRTIFERMLACKEGVENIRESTRAELTSGGGHHGIDPGQDVDFRGGVCAQGRSLASGIGELHSTDGDPFADLSPEEKAGLEKFLAGMPKLDVKL